MPGASGVSCTYTLSTGNAIAIRKAYLPLISSLEGTRIGAAGACPKPLWPSDLDNPPWRESMACCDLRAIYDGHYRGSRGHTHSALMECVVEDHICCLDTPPAGNSCRRQSHICIYIGVLQFSYILFVASFGGPCERRSPSI
jgi:hypothetical protein